MLLDTNANDALKPHIADSSGTRIAGINPLWCGTILSFESAHHRLWESYCTMLDDIYSDKCVFAIVVALPNCSPSTVVAFRDINLGSDDASAGDSDGPLWCLPESDPEWPGRPQASPGAAYDSVIALPGTARHQARRQTLRPFFGISVCGATMTRLTGGSTPTSASDSS